MSSEKSKISSEKSKISSEQLANELSKRLKNYKCEGQLSMEFIGSNIEIVEKESKDNIAKRL